LKNAFQTVDVQGIKLPDRTCNCKTLLLIRYFTTDYKAVYHC